MPTRVGAPSPELLRELAAAGVTTESAVCRVGERSEKMERAWDEPKNEIATLVQPPLAEDPPTQRIRSGPFVSEPAINHLTAVFAAAAFVPVQPVPAPAPAATPAPRVVVSGTTATRSARPRSVFDRMSVELLFFFIDGFVCGASCWYFFGGTL